MFSAERPHKFRDPIHGFIYVSELERQIIDSAPFQRLRNISQLALTSYVFHGAEHTRFGHSLGVMHLVSKAFLSAVSKGKYLFGATEEKHTQKVAWLEQILRLIALTHDLGHPPFSHGAEGMFPLKEASKNTNKYYKHEDLTELLIKNPNIKIAELISDIGSQFMDKYGEEYNITPEIICDIYRGRLPGENSIFTFLRTFMDSELDCDKMDYLLRDSLFCGVTYGKYDIERLIACLTIFEKNGTSAPFLGVESGGIQAFEEFVLARYFMFTQVYFHRTRRCFDLLLTHALKETLPKGYFPIDEPEFIKWDDTRVMQMLKDCSSNAALRIIERKPLSLIYETKVHPEGDGLTLFKTVKKALITKFGKETFNAHFLIDDSADKLPHKIMPQKYKLDEEETIAIVDARSGKPNTISDKSQIIDKITEKINIQRIYSDEIYKALAKAVVDELLPGQEEDADAE